MNLKELETLVAEQVRKIAALQATLRGYDEAMSNLTGRTDRQTVALSAKIEELKQALGDVNDRMNGMNDTLAGVYDEVRIATGDVLRIENWLGAEEVDSDGVDGPFYKRFIEMQSKLEDVAAKVEGRNKSAAVKRNMTDADALEVLTGQYKVLGHKEAAEAIGLTYAQVYSCRLCFTFKHVHNTLEKTGWKNTWAKAG